MKLGLKEFTNKLDIIFKTERKLEVAFLIFSLAFKLMLDIPFSNMIFIVMFALFLLTFISNYFLKKQTDIEKANFVCFIHWLITITLIALVVYYLGNIWWIGIAILMLPVMYSNIWLSKKKGLFLAIYASFCYAGIGLLEYSGIIPHQAFFNVSPELYQDPLYVLITIAVGSLVIFPYIAYIVNMFSDLLRRRSDELVKTYAQLKDTKETLEVRVKARVRELEEFSQGLEQKIAERTKELEEKVKELEKFQKFAVGREIKMVELKKKIKQLKNRNNQNNQQS